PAAMRELAVVPTRRSSDLGPGGARDARREYARRPRARSPWIPTRGAGHHLLAHSERAERLRNAAFAARCLAPASWAPDTASVKADRKSTRLNSSHVRISYA